MTTYVKVLKDGSQVDSGDTEGSLVLSSTGVPGGDSGRR